jgi:hypothetical protein
MKLAAIAFAACAIAALNASAMAHTARQSDATPAAPPAPDLTLVTKIAGDPAARRPLARLRSPLCLAVAAEDEGFARTVAKRVIANAKAAGVPTRRAGCKPNALVTFSDDAAAQIATYRAEGRKLFRQMSEREIDAALAGRDPAYVFQAVEQTPRIMQGDAGFGLGAGEAWTKERSFLRTPEDILTTLVVIEANATQGLSPVQVADYASLRLLAPTGEVAVDGEIAPPTILTLFAAPAEAPSEMTRTDRAYLRALYSQPRTAFASEVLAEAVKGVAR